LDERKVESIAGKNSLEYGNGIGHKKYWCILLQEPSNYEKESHT
jgi:hypothetical protein